MPEWIIASLLGLGAGLASGGLNFWQGERNREKSQDFSEEQQRLSFEQQLELLRRQQEYNSYQNQVNMMRQAGLNVGLMYNGSAGSASSGLASTPGMASQPQYHVTDTQKGFSDLGNLIIGAMNAKSNAYNSRAALMNAISESLRTGKQIQGIELDNLIKRSDYQYRDMKNQLDIMQGMAGIAETNAAAKELLSRDELNSMRTQYTQQQINNAALEYQKNSYRWQETVDNMIENQQLMNAIAERDWNKACSIARQEMYRTQVMDDFETYVNLDNWQATSADLALNAASPYTQVEKRVASLLGVIASKAGGQQQTQQNNSPKLIALLVTLAKFLK